MIRIWEMAFSMTKFRYLLVTLILTMKVCVHMHAYAKQQTFKNPEGSPVAPNSPKDWLLFVARRLSGVGNGRHSNDVLQSYILDRDAALAGFLRQRTADTITWMGHATFFIKIAQTHILTDPFFSNNAGK